MGILRTAVVSACLVLAASSTSTAVYFQSKITSSNDSRTSHRVIVKLRDAKSLQKANGSSASLELQSLAEQFAANSVDELEFGGSSTRGHGAFSGFRIVGFEDVNSAQAFAAACAASSLIEYAEPDYLLELFDIPDDPLFGYQWNLRNVGQPFYSVYRIDGNNNDILTMTTGRPGADIKATEFHNSSSNDTVIVAIIDSGIDRMHPDLDGVIWQNKLEVAGNALDDDHNGYVDDTWGWDFSANENLIPIYSDNDPMDTYGHGSHCAGVVGAVTNNHIGVAGVSTHAKLMALKIWPTMSISLAARAVIYAVDNGAEVISMSWGTPYESLLLRDALSYARSRGVVLCAASGNSGAEEAFYPSAYDFVIAVGASSSRDNVTSFSTFGYHIDLCAPGESILSLRGGTTDMYAAAPSNEPGVHVLSNNYYEASGTSMACPHVAGAAAELKAHSPGLRPERIEQILYESCDEILDPRGNGGNMPGKDRYSGYGRLNIKNALERTPRIVAKIDTPVEGAILSGNISINGTAIGEQGQSFSITYRAAGSDEWITAIESAANVNNGLLANWDTGQLDGAYELRLAIGETNEVTREVLVVSQPRAEFLRPLPNEILSGAGEIQIVAVCPDFERATIEYRAAGSTGAWSTIAALSVPSFGEESIFWDSSELEDGDYAIMIRVYSANEPADSDEVVVHLSSPFSGSRGWRVPIGMAASIVPNYGDFDGDGQNEIVVGTDEGVNFYNLDGTPKTTGIPDIVPGHYLVPPVVCDLDDDSTDDLVLMKELLNTLYTIPSSGEIFDTVFYNEPNTSRYSAIKESLFPLVFAIDLDSDGHDEILYKPGRLTSAGDEDLVVISPYRTEESCFPLDLECAVVQAADLDGDSLCEIYTGSVDGRIRKFNLCGEVIEQLNLGNDIWQFSPTGMTAVDYSGDGLLDLAVMGYIRLHALDVGYVMFALDGNFRVIDKQVLTMGIPSVLDPSMAVFGDIDGDYDLETIVSFHDANYGYVSAWHSDRTPVVPNQPIGGLLGKTLHPGMCAMPLLVDVDGNGVAEALCPTVRDLFGTFPRQRVEVFNSMGGSVPGWPLFVAPHSQEQLTRPNVPVYGDLDSDGDMDMIMITPNDELVFTSFDQIPWDPKKSPCPMWRYNRKLNNVVPTYKDISVDVDEDPVGVPSAFMSAQNFPNPFNLSTVIEYNLPRSGEVGIAIYNILGQTISSHSLPLQRAGRHRFSWEAVRSNGAPLPSGIYFYKVSSNNMAVSGKMMLLK